MKKPSIEKQWWERRGTMVYGQDFGPGTAIMVVECDSAAEAQRVVDEHSGALEGGAA